MMSGIGRMIAGGMVGVALAGCAASAAPSQAGGTATTPTATSTPAGPSPAATSTSAGPSPAVSLARGGQETGDVDGDGRPDRAQLLYLGGNGPGNWELVVDMTTLGQQTVRFTGGRFLPGNTAAPTIAGSADADRDGHAEIFIKVSSGASTQSWIIFKLAGQRIRQVTSQGQPLRLAVGGSVTHQDGFRCNGAQFVTVSEATGPPYTTWTYKRDTYTWSGAELVPVSTRTGRVTSAQPGSPPAAYSGVSCGALPQYAPAYGS
jgi:hypothetical protein